MLALYIIGPILLLLVILLCSPFRICISCVQNKFTLTVKYMFFKKTLFPATHQKTEKEIKEKKEKKEQPSDKGEKKQKKKREPKSKSEKTALIINIMKSSGKAFKVFTKRITIKDITVDIDISDEDACDCAVKFGKANIVVYNLLSFCSVFFKVKKKYINIRCVYNQPESIYNFGFTVKFTPAAGILSAIAFIFTFLVNNIKNKRKDKMLKKQKHNSFYRAKYF